MMRINRYGWLVPGVLLLASLCFTGPVSAEKPPELGRTKFKDIAKYLDLTADQQAKIKPDVDRIQEIVKDADKQRGRGGWGAGGRRTPVGGSGVFGRPGPDSAQGAPTTNIEEMIARRKEWQVEITNRVEEIKSFLTPGQLEKFKSIDVPNLLDETR